MTAILSVDDLLHAIKYSKESPLRVYLGAAPGVGKTYRMLVDGNMLKAKGIDVVVGYLEYHGREETIAQVKDLEVLPRRKLLYRGVKLEEMDTAAIIARKPQIVLVDELAHTNVHGSQHAKRYEDIEDILAAGIAVFSTCNIQHLESVCDVVERTTGVEVKERVPDQFFNLAKEMIIVDVTPEELIDRMHQGKIYPKERVERSLKNFFTYGNISLLRELALRELANDVEQKDKEQRQQVSKAGVVSSEKILVAIPARPDAKQLLRAASRMAGRLNARWFAAYVEPPSVTYTEQTQQTLQENLKLAKDLGASVVQLRGNDVAHTITAFAEEEGITHIVLGATRRAWWKRLLSPSVVGSLLKNVGEIAVHVLPSRREDEENTTPSQPEAKPAVQRVRITEYIDERSILATVRDVQTVEQTISMLIDHLIGCHPELAQHRQMISERIMKRERLTSTFLETGIAIPHASGFEMITDIHAVMALTPNGILSLDRDQKAYIMVLFLSPESGPANHLKFLAAIASVFVDHTTTREIAGSRTAQEAYEIIQRIEQAGRIS